MNAKLTTVLCSVVSILSLTASAAERVWTGLGPDALWATPANWDSGAPSATDTALFSGDGNGKTAISLGSGAASAGVTFAAPAAYTLGAAGETLTMNAGNITLAADSAADATIAAKVLLNGTVNIYQYAPSHTLFIPDLTVNANRSLYIYGTGPVTFGKLQRPAGTEENDTTYIRLETRLSAPVTCTEPLIIGQLWNYTYPLDLRLAPGTTNIFCRNDWNFAINSGGTINGGEGTVLKLVQPTAANQARVASQSGTVTVNVQLHCPGGLTCVGGWTLGTFVFTHPDNDIPGPITIDRGNVVEVPYLAPAGTRQPLGQGSIFNFVNPLQGTVPARLRVVGDTASATDKTFTIEKDRAIIENASAAPLTLSGPVTGDGTLVLETLSDITFAGVRSGAGGLTKTGPGTLTVTAANTYTGDTTFEGGILALPDGAALGSGSLVFAGGTLALNSTGAATYSVTLPAVTLSASSCLTIPAATSSSVTFSSFAPNGNTLVISAPSAGTAANRIIINGLAEGLVDGILLNGSPAAYSLANGLYPSTLPPTSVSGDTLPDAPGSAAIISTTPAGSISIASPLTTLGQFSYTGAAPAILDLNGGTLALNYLTATAPLTVINGTLTAPGISANATYPGLRTAAAVPLTSDAATGISPSKTYTHLIDFGNLAAVATINGVTFTKGAANGTGDTYAGFPNANGYNNLNAWTNTLPPETCSGLITLLNDMNYTGGANTASLSGLTPGAVYELTLYLRAWDDLTSTQERRALYEFCSVSDTMPDTTLIFASQPNTPHAIVYRYLAPASGTITVKVTPVAVSGNVASGCFGFTNEELAPGSGDMPASGSIAIAGPVDISAAVTDNGAPTLLVIAGDDEVTLSGPVSLTGPALFDAPVTLAPPAASGQTYNGAIVGNAPITVNGAGITVFRQASPALNSPITIVGGILEAGHSQALGASTLPGVTVTAGGALAIGQTANNSITIPKNVTIAGSGPDGFGALRYDYDGLQYNALLSITLAGNATVGGTIPSPLPSNGNRGRFDIRNGTLDLNGHTLSKAGPNTFIVTSSKILNVGPNTGINVQGGVFGLEASTDLNGSAANILAVHTGASLDLYNLATAITWTTRFEDKAHLSVRSGGISQNELAGPVILESGQAILDSLSTAAHNTISGPASGNGGFLKAYGGVTFLKSTASTFSGTVTVTNGILHARAPGSAPSAPAALTVSGNGVFVARYAPDASTDGWSLAELKALAAGGTYTSSAALGIDTAAASLDFTDNWPATGLVKFGINELTFSGFYPAGGSIRVHEGSLDLNAAAQPLNLGANSVIVGADNLATTPAYLPLAGNTALITTDNGYNTAQSEIIPGSVASSRGVITIDDNARISGRLMVGRDSGSAGAIYQTGGSFLNTGGAGPDGRIGQTGFGYYEISGGSLTNKGYTQLSHNATGAGTLRAKGNAHIQFNSGAVPAVGSVGDYYGGHFATRAGYGHFHLSGNATLDTGAANINLCEWDAANNYNNGTGFLTIEENAAVSANTVNLANRNSAPVAAVTLNGGTLTTAYLRKGGNTTSASAAAIVNFNGGTLRAKQNGTLVQTAANNVPARLAVHSGGAAFDTPTGISATIDLPLDAATAGVTAIEVNAQGAGYIAPPAVLITGGGGIGAVAEAILTDGSVTGVRIVSPGSGYTSQPTVAFNGGGYTSAATVRTVSIGHSGTLPSGLTKIGDGILGLNADNTYQGPTIVTGGILIPAVSGALPDGSDLFLYGGSLTLNSERVHTNTTTYATSGSLVGSGLSTTAFVKDGDGTLDLSTRVNLDADLDRVVRAAKIPGLREYRLDGDNNTNAVDTAVFGPTVQLTTRALHGNVGSGGTLNGAFWPDQTTYVYTGYLWNSEPTNVTWTFMQNMDDRLLLRVDGSIVLNKGYDQFIPYRTIANAGTCCTITLTPGPHAIEIRASQGGGGVGGYWTKSDGTRPAFGIDPQARDEANVEYLDILTDPGDGSLFTINNPYDDLGIDFAAVHDQTPDLPSDVLAGVGSLADGYSLVYQATVPVNSATIFDDTLWRHNTATSNSNAFDRVAYVLRLVKRDSGEVQWVWTSFEPVTGDRTKLAFPISAKRMTWQQRVRHLDVRSNVAAVTDVTDSDTGNIEFYTGNYTHTVSSLAYRGYVGSSDIYDFDDQNSSNSGANYGNASGYGCLQVHNFGNAQTIFAINNFGNVNSTLCVGIGNNPNAAATGSSGQPQRDWTFAPNAGEYVSRELYILTRDITPAVDDPVMQVNGGTLRVVDTPITTPVPSDICTKVGDLADGYDMVYYSPIATTAAAAYNGTAYHIDNSAKTEPFDRVAYFLEIRNQKTQQTQWVWVSFNAHTQDRTKLGYPNRNGATFLWQQKVFGMDVRSNVEAVTDVTGADTGNLEIWPSNYSTGTTLGDIGGSGSIYDFDDTGANLGHGHGSFQIHNWGAQQTLFSVAHCGSAANVLGLGIGNDPNPSNPNALDYTWAVNAGDFDIRNLYVFVRPAVSPEDNGKLLADIDLDLAADATLDLNNSAQAVRSITGSGTIANGTLANGSVYRVKINGLTCSHLTLDNVDISNWTVIPADAASANPPHRNHEIAAGSFTGLPALSGFPGRFELKIQDGHRLILAYKGGALMILK